MAADRFADSASKYVHGPAMIASVHWVECEGLKPLCIDHG